MSTSRLIFDDKERVGAWVADRVGFFSPFGGFYAMGAELDGELTSGVVVQSWTNTTAIAHLAVSKPTKLMAELFDHTIAYVFGQLGLRRLTAYVDADNEKSLKLTSHIGFVDEAILQGAGDNGVDIHVRVLWPQNYCRGIRHG